MSVLPFCELASMPFKSKAQIRAFFAKESNGELPHGTAKHWLKETHSARNLPERKKGQRTK